MMCRIVIIPFLLMSLVAFQEASSIDEPRNMPETTARLPMKLPDKRYFIGSYFKTNWYQAFRYCRSIKKHLVSISTQEQYERIKTLINMYGLSNERFWTSGTDFGSTLGHYYWMGNGQPITFNDWGPDEPNNTLYTNGEYEHCLELWNPDGSGYIWNDVICSQEAYFICEKSEK